LLDFGAGCGELLDEVHRLGRFARLFGADITPRPDGRPASIDWISQDLNEPLETETAFDTIVSTEVIEHLENPRAFARTLLRLLKPGGIAVVTTPNQNSIRSLVALCLVGDFAAFRVPQYPAHITALTNNDLVRVFEEAGFKVEGVYFSDRGCLPAWPRFSWQQFSFGLLRGRLFSDNVAVLLRKPA
jgi:2-polyprenyl-3-methyl-5-hydroxy-6-metoxy-1,4-benzoquinol methylase